MGKIGPGALAWKWIKRHLKLRKNTEARQIHDAVKSNDTTQLVRHLLAGVDVDSYNRQYITPLHLACEQDTPLTVALLLAAGADANIASDPEAQCSTPLIVAASHGHVESVELLLRAGASIDVKDSWGNTALFKSVAYGHVTCVRALIDHGACPNVANKWGATCLQYAALLGNQELVEILLTAGADADARGDPSDPHPLCVMARDGHVICMNNVLSAGANVEAGQECSGYTPLYYAIQFHMEECRAVGKDPVTQGDRSDGRLQCALQLIEHGAKVTQPCIEILNDNIPVLLADYKSSSGGVLCRALFRACQRDSNRTHTWITHILTVALETCNTNALADIYDSGFKPSMHEIDTANTDQSNAAMTQILAQFASPRPLMQLAKLRIQNILSVPQEVIINQLPLPVPVKNYICGRDVW